MTANIQVHQLESGEAALRLSMDSGDTEKGRIKQSVEWLVFKSPEEARDLARQIYAAAGPAPSAPEAPSPQPMIEPPICHGCGDDGDRWSGAVVEACPVGSEKQTPVWSEKPK